MDLSRADATMKQFPRDNKFTLYHPQLQKCHHLCIIGCSTQRYHIYLCFVHVTSSRANKKCIALISGTTRVSSLLNAEALNSEGWQDL